MVSEALNGLSFDGRIVSLKDVDLDSVYEVEILLLGMGKRVNDNKVPKEIFHPRDAVRFSKYFMRRSLSERDETYARDHRSEVEYASKQIEELKKSKDDDAENEYRLYMQSFERSTEDAGARLSEKEVEAKDKITQINKSWQEELKILDERARGYRRTGAKVVAATTSIASVYFASYKGLNLDPLLSITPATASVFGIVPLVDKWYDGKKSRINRRFIDDIREVEGVHREQKVIVYLQTLAEVTNNLNRFFPDSVAFYSPKVNIKEEIKNIQEKYKGE